MKEDYSIIVPPDSSKEDILARLFEFRGLVDQKTNTEKLKKSLHGHLKKNHPLHGQVEKLSSHQLKKLCDRLGLTGHNWHRPRMQTAIKTYYFKNFPDGPLTALQEALVPAAGKQLFKILPLLLFFLIIRAILSQPFGLVEIMVGRTPSTNTLQFDKLITQR